MWRGNPALTAVLFGLPMGFFSLICYSICCADIMDAEEDEDDGDDLGKFDFAWKFSRYPFSTKRRRWDVYRRLSRKDGIA